LTWLQRHTGQIAYESASVTHEGRVRKFNEDSVFSDEHHGVWIVADGMGGHKSGNIASAMVADAAQSLGPSSSAAELVSRLSHHLQSVNARLLTMSDGDSRSLVGTTVVALLFHGDSYACVWAGDSRCYLIRGNQISQLSHDHTEVQELVDSGAISREEARFWPRRNVITRAVGAERELDLDMVTGRIEPGDSFLLCSDGLTGHVDEREIQSAVRSSGAREACEKLLNLALERGGRDNISVVIINVMRRSDATVIQHR
jgi:protein phosphatase